ncbi:MAG: hypothetical protein KDJ19_05180 [Hyphomicrobiaceae bacterium]|nr:hypothetical protein [Hyphomicrobiaceae bacterium]MCC0023234.1 hypothetical protein [Hyphomicrobiaceae bacterium]
MSGAVKVGSEFQINSTITYDQYEVKLTALTNGTFVATWVSKTDATTHKHIFAQRFNIDGTPLGSQFRVDTGAVEATFSVSPDITALDDGGFMIVWSQSSGSIRVQRYDADGVADSIVSQQQLNQITNGSVSSPSIAPAAGGGWFVFFSSYNVDNDTNTQDTSIQAALLDNDGNYEFTPGEFTVRAGGATTSDSGRSPDVAKLSDDGHVAVWRDTASGTESIMMQLYYASGTANGAPVQVDSRMVTNKFEPTVIALANDDFLVMWRDSPDAFDTGIRAVHFRPDGLGYYTAGTEFSPTDDAGPHYGTNLAVSALPDGGYILTWAANGPADNYGIYAQRFDAADGKVGDTVLVNTITDGYQLDPSVTTLANGAFTIAWESSFGTSEGGDGDGSGVFGQLFKAQLFGTNSRDTLTDDVGANWMDGRSGGDNLNGKGGDDVIYGQDGADTILGGSGKDSLFGGNQNDDLDGGSDDDILKGQSGKDTLAGKSGNDQLLGGSQNDTLDGGADDDILKGQSGNDRLIVGKGNDKATGGSGDDRFIFGKHEDTNTITDFQNNRDRIDLKAFGFASKAQALSKFQEVGSSTNDMIKFEFKGTTIKVKGIDMPQLDNSDIII